MVEYYFKTRNEWRKWLSKNHDKSTGIWVIYFKKHTKKQSLAYDEAVEEALCFGWIDSKVNRLDEERYKQIFTPRNKRSVWSLLNTQRVEKMIAEGKMTEYGMKKVTEAKENGRWQNAYSSKIKTDIPADLIEELKKNKIAYDNFYSFSSAQQLQYIHWINDAVRKETRDKRINQLIQLAFQNIKPTSAY